MIKINNTLNALGIFNKKGAAMAAPFLNYIFLMKILFLNIDFTGYNLVTVRNLNHVNSAA